MPPTTRNKTPIKKHGLTNRQSDDSTNQYAALSETETKSTSSIDETKDTPLVTEVEIKVTVPPPDTINQRIACLERTIGDIGARQSISKETSYHILDVSNSRFDALNMRLHKDVVPTQVSTTPTTSTWSTVVRGKSKEDPSSISTKSVTFGAKMVHEDIKVSTTLPRSSQQPNNPNMEHTNGSSTDGNNPMNSDYNQDDQI